MKIVKFRCVAPERERRIGSMISPHDIDTEAEVVGSRAWKVPLTRERQATCAAWCAISTPRAQTKNRQFISRLPDAIATSFLLHTILHHFAALPFKFYPDRIGGSRVIADARNPSFGLMYATNSDVFQKSSTF